LETAATDGKTYKTRFYNLDAIIAIGYRVNSVVIKHSLFEQAVTGGSLARRNTRERRSQMLRW
jgi:hypothetical protein